VTQRQRRSGASPTAPEASTPSTVPEDPAMAAALQALALDAEIPPALYRAVAATLDWASDLDERLRRGDQLRHQSS